MMTYQEFFEAARKKGFENIQITEELKRENSAYLINEKVEDYTDSEKISFTIKAEIKGKTEQVYTEYLDESIIDLLLEKINTTESQYEDDYLINVENNEINETINVDITNELDFLKQTPSLTKQFPQTKSLETAYGDTYIKTRIINTNGVDIATSSHNYELYVESSAEKNKELSTYSEQLLVNDKQTIDFTKIINKVLDLTTIGVEKRKLETKKYDIILSNKVTAQIITSLGTMLSALDIHQKKSCLENKLNKKVFSDKLTILEEPQNKNYPGCTIFDKEGTTTINKEIIKNGEIKTYLYDIKEAKVDNILSTGNKYNGIGTRNMYIVPTSKKITELFKEMDNGIYITSYMGSSGTAINCASGNISMQVFGYIVEKGQITCGFHPAVMTTSIFELLANIKAIGGDLNFVSKSTGAPSLYIKNISIAGE